LAEEMRCVVAYFEYASKHWRELAQQPTFIGKERLDCALEIQEMQAKEAKVILASKKCYAYRQAGMRDAMKARCDTKWVGISAKLMSMEGRDARIMVECC